MVWSCAFEYEQQGPAFFCRCGLTQRQMVKPSTAWEEAQASLVREQHREKVGAFSACQEKAQGSSGV